MAGVYQIYNNDDNYTYPETRKHYSWLKYCKIKSYKED